MAAKQTQAVRIDGLEPVLGLLRALPEELQGKGGGIVRAALRAQAVVLRDEIRSNIDRIVAEPNKGNIPTESTGDLRDSVRVKKSKLPGGTNGERFLVGVLPLTKAYVNSARNRRAGQVGKEYTVLPPTYYAWFLEYGTERMEPHPFIFPAFDAKKEDVARDFARRVEERLMRVLERYERMKGKNAA